ncbi:uncharacterized protein LOC102948787 isoform X2 [Panthera tigris]|uniref:uncharacterized protein LOC102948787 isoform X2 n=1 Tax=Panthera tigris TaxID=9694 RepID=UPI001C6F8537|nr:uncharacterized protein LOC102948787 isoform X2 [Panthera tigris]
MSPFCCYALLSVCGQRLLSPPQDKKRRSELCSLISCCNEADASVDGSQVPAASSLRRAEVTGPAAPNTFPRPVCSSTNNRGATECSPNWKVLQVCECWRPCWSVGTRGFGSRLPGEPSKLATSVLLTGRRHSPVGTGHSGWRGAHADTNCLGDGGGTPGHLPTSVACHRVHERQVLIRCFWLWSLGRPSSVSPSVKWVDQQCPSVGWWGLTEAIFAKNPGTRKGALCLCLPNKTKGSLRWRRDQTQTQRTCEESGQPSGAGHQAQCYRAAGVATAGHTPVDPALGLPLIWVTQLEPELGTEQGSLTSQGPAGVTLGREP